MQKKEDKYLAQAMAYARSCGYEERVEFSHSVNGFRIYKLIPNPDDGLTGYPMVVKVSSKGILTIDIDDDYKF